MTLESRKERPPKFAKNPERKVFELFSFAASKVDESESVDLLK